MKFWIIKTVFILLTFYLKGQDIDSLKSVQPIETVIVHGDRIDNPPKFNHPEFTDFRKWLFNELNKQQPEEYCFGNLDLMVYFTVNSRGQIKNIDVIKKQTMVVNKSHWLTVGCVKFLTRLVESSGTYWTGGTNNGIPISVSYSFSIEFK